MLERTGGEGEALSIPRPKGTDEHEQHSGCTGPLSSCFKPHLALSSLSQSSLQASSSPTEGRELGTGPRSPCLPGVEDAGAERAGAFYLPTPTPACLCEQAVKRPLVGSVVSARSSQPQGL